MIESNLLAFGQIADTNRWEIGSPVPAEWSLHGTALDLKALLGEHPPAGDIHHGYSGSFTHLIWAYYRGAREAQLHIQAWVRVPHSVRSDLDPGGGSSCGATSCWDHSSFTITVSYCVQRTSGW